MCIQSSTNQNEKNIYILKRKFQYFPLSTKYLVFFRGYFCYSEITRIGGIVQIITIVKIKNIVIVLNFVFVLN